MRGEYMSVVQQMPTPARRLLGMAHRRPCTPESARALVTLLAEHYSFPAPAVRFRLNAAGCYVHHSDGDHYILLPAERLGRGRNRSRDPRGYLRVGLVLHEFAHALVRHRLRRRGGHGVEFVETLAELLALTEGLW
jgi:hypothetical protein